MAALIEEEWLNEDGRPTKHRTQYHQVQPKRKRNLRLGPSYETQDTVTPTQALCYNLNPTNPILAGGLDVLRRLSICCCFDFQWQ